MSVAIVGAGISGLAAGVFIDDAVIFEANTTAGGWVQQVLQASRAVYDQAANGWLSNEPAVPMLIEKLGLQNELLQASPAALCAGCTTAIKCVCAEQPAAAQKPVAECCGQAPLAAVSVADGASPTPMRVWLSFCSAPSGCWCPRYLVGSNGCWYLGARPEELSVDAAFPLLRELEQHGSLFAESRPVNVSVETEVKQCQF